MKYNTQFTSATRVSSQSIVTPGEDVMEADTGDVYVRTASGWYQTHAAGLPLVNTEVILLALAARTATTTSASIENYNASGLIIVVNVTAVPGVETITAALLGVDSISGTVYQISAVTTGLSATGIASYLLSPGAANSGAFNMGVNVNGLINVPIPRTFQVRMTHSAAGSFTYSVSGVLVL